ncbi:MAG TPA: hypothetical protein DCX53_03260 [Anaerolineae bacterium]|nr:hypothetical protein [Anaerolineae bacterium]
MLLFELLVEHQINCFIPNQFKTFIPFFSASPSPNISRNWTTSVSFPIPFEIVLGEFMPH